MKRLRRGNADVDANVVVVSKGAAKDKATSEQNLATRRVIRS